MATFKYICNRGHTFKKQYETPVPICPECKERAHLVESDPDETIINRSPWYRDPSLCPLCGGKREVAGLPCACTMEVKHL